jgi:hypothetical protein
MGRKEKKDDLVLSESNSLERDLEKVIEAHDMRLRKGIKVEINDDNGNHRYEILAKENRENKLSEFNQ